ncbi:hypothetical protein SDC9_49467 [bioreactor metagenome]|uniref:Uncharacterized protein n=1 Tax=bioreactor metagenome TaxID=1076179 RepID=A0A644WLB0_9ZZZZ
MQTVPILQIGIGVEEIRDRHVQAQTQQRFSIDVGVIPRAIGGEIRV